MFWLMYVFSSLGLLGALIAKVQDTLVAQKEASTSKEMIKSKDAIVSKHVAGVGGTGEEVLFYEPSASSDSELPLTPTADEDSAAAL